MFGRLRCGLGHFERENSVKTDIVKVGGTDQQAVWLRAKMRQSKNESLFIVHLDVPGLAEPAVFYATSDEVRPSNEDPQVEDSAA
jgi:hypothetical protein